MSGPTKRTIEAAWKRWAKEHPWESTRAGADITFPEAFRAGWEARGRQS